MLIKAYQKFVRTSPRKLRLVADAIRGLSLPTAFDLLQSLNKQAALPLRKTLKQAVANAVNNLHLNESELKIKEIQINAGATFKRWQPVSRGRTHSIMKRTSHLRVILEAPDQPVKPIATPSQPKLVKTTKPRRSGSAKAKTIKKSTQKLNPKSTKQKK